MIYDEYSDIHDVVLLIRLLRHLPRFPDGDRCGSMETDTGIDDEGNARTPIIYSPCSLIPPQPISYLSPILQPGAKVAKPFLGGSLSGTLCGGVKGLLSISSGKERENNYSCQQMAFCVHVEKKLMIYHVDDHDGDGDDDEEDMTESGAIYPC